MMQKGNINTVRWLRIGLIWLSCLSITLSYAKWPQSIQMGGDSVLWFNPHSSERTRLLFDYYHHGLPNTKVGNHLITGSWVDNDGRYGWDDFVHTNTFDHAYTILEEEFTIGANRQPYTENLLQTTDGVVIIAADNPKLIPRSKLISDEEITALRNFVNRGGSLMLMLNGGGAGRFSESFESKQVRKLVNGFGLDWNDDDTHYSDNVLPKGHPYFYDVPTFHYGAGCTLKILPEASRPEVLLNVYADEGYPDRSVNGPGIVMTRPGRGKFILVGDAGSWTGNLSRPWAENERVLKQLFRYMKPDQGVQAATYELGKPLIYDVTVAGMQAIPLANTLSGVSRPLYKSFSPRPITDMPFIESTASITLIPRAETDLKSIRAEGIVSDFQWFDRPTTSSEEQTFSLMISKQGKVSDLEASGEHARWLAPDLPALIALLPVDGIRPGDSWESIENLRIPNLRGTDLPTVKLTNIDIHYVKNDVCGDKDCRLLQSSGEMWLDDLGIKVTDLLPEEEVKRVGGSNYRYFNKRGGKLLFKREQWVDMQSGMVVKARLQTRVIAWIQDTRKPVATNNADKDNEMIVSLANITTFSLNEAHR